MIHTKFLTRSMQAFNVLKR